MTVLPQIARPTQRRRAAAVAAVLAGVLLAGCGEDDPTPVADDPGDETSSAAPSTPAGPADPPSSEGAGEVVTAPIYFVGDTPQGPRLFREFQDVEADNPAAEAVAKLVAGDSLDPDYRSLLPTESITDARVEGDLARVTLTDDRFAERPADLTAAEAAIAVQSVVYTMQGVSQTRVPLQVLGTDGEPTTLLGVDTGEGLRQANQLETLGLVNVTSPAEGDTVGGTFEATGVASSFEATVPWEIRRGGADGEVVLDGAFTAEGWIERLYPYAGQVDVSALEPGDYTFVAMTDDPSDGEAGGPTEDTKAIVVE